jgi:hypothetical protein
MLVLRASNAGRASGEYAVLQPRWNQALDALVLLHRTLKWYYSCVQWLRDVSSSFEPSCAPDAVASVDPSSDASGERKSSLVAYWSASDVGRRTRPVLVETTIEL